jgi:hypothetical protein
MVYHDVDDNGDDVQGYGRNNAYKGGTAEIGRTLNSNE